MVLSPENITLIFGKLDDRPGTQLSVVKMNPQRVTAQFSVSENWPDAGRLSPDGLWLTFQTTQDNVQTIWVMDTHTGAVHHVTDYARLFVNIPVWSPDSQYMAYTVWEGDEGYNRELLYVMDTKTRQSHRLTNHAGNDRFPAWSPDGRWLAVISDRDHSPSIYLIDPLTGETQKVVSTHFPLDLFGSPVWSPDGQRLGLIVWNETTISRDIYLVDIANHSISYLAESNFLVWQP
jgi:Tol biopolymer transport system component